jgi:hypothetical protein
MTRRVAVFLVLGALLAIPGVSPAAPTGGVVRVYECVSPPPPSYDSCGAGEGNVRVGIAFDGNLALNGGTYTGVFGVGFIAHKGSGLNYRFDNAPLNGPANIETPFDVPLFGPLYMGLPLAPNPKIWGSCSGTRIEGRVIRLGCSFHTEDGLSGYRDLIVTYVYDLQTNLCDALCDGGGGPCNCDSSTGVFARDYLKAL